MFCNVPADRSQHIAGFVKGCEGFYYNNIIIMVLTDWSSQVVLNETFSEPEIVSFAQELPFYLLAWICTVSRVMLARRLQDKDTANSHGIKGLGLNSEMTFFC